VKLLPLVLKNLLRKKTRSALTIGSIVLPLFVICILGTLLRALDSDPSGGKGMYRLIVRHKVSITNWLPGAYDPKIRNLPGVVETLRMNWFGGSYIDQSAKNQFARFSTSDADRFLKVFDEATVAEGSEADWVNDRSGLLDGRQLMKRFGWKLGQKVSFKGDIYPITLELTIRAVYAAPDESGVYFHHQAIEEALPRVKGFVGWYWLKADSLAATERVPKQIDAMFENSSWPTRSETEKEFQAMWVSMLGNVKLLVGSITTIIGIVILLIAANTMAMAARERVTEIAVFRVLGFGKEKILGLVLGESLALSLFGGFLGLGLFVLMLPGFREGLVNSPMGAFAAGVKLFPEVLLLGFGVTVAVGLFAGLVPAIRSATRPITEGLRQVA
jgi:putative ABC transport system permease protein